MVEAVYDQYASLPHIYNLMPSLINMLKHIVAFGDKGGMSAYNLYIYIINTLLLSDKTNL